jgi:type VI protein secretion system component Hcp
MAIDGIPGDGRVLGFEGWLKLSSFDWGGARGATLQTDRHGRQGAMLMPPQVRAVKITRASDAVTPQIWDLMITYARKSVAFVWIRTGGDMPSAYLNLNLTNALIISMEEQAFGGAPQETMSITFEEFTMTVVNVGDNLSGPQDVLSYVLPSAQRG